MYVEGIDGAAERAEQCECTEAFFCDGQLSAHGIDQYWPLDRHRLEEDRLSRC